MCGSGASAEDAPLGQKPVQPGGPRAGGGAGPRGAPQHGRRGGGRLPREGLAGGQGRQLKNVGEEFFHLLTLRFTSLVKEVRRNEA